MVEFIAVLIEFSIAIPVLRFPEEIEQNGMPITKGGSKAERMLHKLSSIQVLERTSMGVKSPHQSSVAFYAFRPANGFITWGKSRSVPLQVFRCFGLYCYDARAL